MQCTGGECPSNYGMEFINIKSFLKEELSTFKEEIREEISVLFKHNMLYSKCYRVSIKCTNCRLRVIVGRLSEV
jgi:hypothetical protein